MRRLLIVPAGLAAAAIVAAAGIGVANAATGPSAERQPTRQTAAASTGISRSDAERAALAAVPGGTVVQTRLDTGNGRTVWNVHLSTSDGPIEVEVDARSGAVRFDDDAPGRGGNPGRRGGDDPATDHAGDDRAHAAEPGDDRGHVSKPGGDRGHVSEPGDDRGHVSEPGDDRGHGGDDGPGHH